MLEITGEVEQILKAVLEICEKQEGKMTEDDPTAYESVRYKGKENKGDCLI